MVEKDIRHYILDTLKEKDKYLAALYRHVKNERIGVWWPDRGQEDLSA